MYFKMEFYEHERRDSVWFEDPKWKQINEPSFIRFQLSRSNFGSEIFNRDAIVISE